ncbi:DUF4190 domain-containing protein [Streptomyces sp. bgisy154]|uniref:DUF4190 domain-containing protein n=1 Tax=Streptomyces sp. bgisy154 TaxID=3413794 RepID=UPI003D70591A
MSIPPPADPQQPEDPFRAPQSQPQGPSYSPAPPPPGAAYPPPGGPGPGPYGAPAPYQPWAQGYTPFNRRPAVNGVAIAALVLGVMCFLPAVGLVLGVIALVQIRRRGERGRPMAITGAVLSALGLALWVVSLSTGVASDAWAGFKEGFRDGSVTALQQGDCFDVPGGGKNFDDYVDYVDEVPCSRRHDAEVFAVVPLDQSAYPGRSGVWEIGDDKCSELSAAYAMDPWAVPENVEVSYLWPTSDSWEYGDHEITCVFTSGSEADALTGSLRADATTLDADQMLFLATMAKVDDVLAEEPEDLAEDDLKVNQEWARDMQGRMAAEAEVLRARTWPSAVQGSVDALIEDMGDAAAEWGKAAGARGVDSFYEHYDTAYGYVDGDTTVEVRKALGLATTPPYGGGFGGGSGGGDSGDSEDRLDV